MVVSFAQKNKSGFTNKRAVYYVVYELSNLSNKGIPGFFFNYIKSGPSINK